MSLRTREDTWTWKRKCQIALSGNHTLDRW